MAAGVFLFVLASLSWKAKSQFLSGAGCQQRIPNIASSSPFEFSSAKPFLTPLGPIGSNCRSSLSNSRSNLESLEPTGLIGSKIPSVLSYTGPQCDSIEPSSSSTAQFLGPLKPTLRQTGFRYTGLQCEPTLSNKESYVSELGCSPSSQFPGLAGSFLNSQSGSIGPQYEVNAPNIELFSPGPCGPLSNLNAPSNFPSFTSCGIKNPSFHPHGPNCGLNNFAGPIKSQIPETTTTQLPSLLGKNQFVSETFVSQKPCQSSLSLSQIGFPSISLNLDECTCIRNVPLTTCTSPAIEAFTTIEDDDESLSNTLANALQLLIVSNLIENLNEATTLGTFTTPLCGPEIVTLPSCNVIENGPGCNDILTPITPIVTDCSNIPSLNSPSSIGSLSANIFGGPRQTPCNIGLREFINPIKVPQLGCYGGVPEIINSLISSSAPHIPDIINPINLKLVEAIKSQLPFGPLPSYNRYFADIINPIKLPSLVQPSVLPEIGNPVNLPAFGSLFSSHAEDKPFNVISYSTLAPTPILAYNVPYELQVPEAFSYNKFKGSSEPETFNYNQFAVPLTPEAHNYNQFNGPFLPEALNYNQFTGSFPPDVSNCNGPLLREEFNLNQFYGNQANPLMALLEQLLTKKANAYSATSYGIPEIFNTYTPYGVSSNQINQFGESYGLSSERNNQYVSGYPVPETPSYGIPETFNTYTPHGAYPNKINSFGESYGLSSEISKQYISGYPVLETPTQLELITSQSPYYGGTADILTPTTLSLTQSPYASNPEETLPYSSPSPSYTSEAFTSGSSSYLNNGSADVSSLSNAYSQPEIVLVPVDIPGIPVTLSGALPDVPLTPANYFSEVKDIPAQIALEPLIAELLIPSSIPAELTLNIQ